MDTQNMFDSSIYWFSIAYLEGMTIYYDLLWEFIIRPYFYLLHAAKFIGLSKAPTMSP